MKKLLTAALIGCVTLSFAQSPVSTRLASGADLGAAFATDRLSPSFTYYQLLNLDARKIFQIGWTVKFQTLYGQNMVYTTAPAKLTRERTGFGALSAPIIPANIDTLTFQRGRGTTNKTSFTALNFGLRAQLHLGPIELGASSDLLGIGFGRGRYGLYEASGDTLKLDGGPLRAQPQRINLRLLGDNNNGFLASDVYIRILFGRWIGTRIGYQWIVSEYRAVDERIPRPNRRFRHTQGMPYVGLTFPFFR